LKNLYKGRSDKKERQSPHLRIAETHPSCVSLPGFIGQTVNDCLNCAHRGSVQFPIQCLQTVFRENSCWTGEGRWLLYPCLSL